MVFLLQLSEIVSYKSRGMDTILFPDLGQMNMTSCESQVMITFYLSEDGAIEQYEHQLCRYSCNLRVVLVLLTTEILRTRCQAFCQAE